MKLILSLIAVIVLSLGTCKAQNFPQLQLFPNSTPNNPIFDIKPVLNLLQVLQNAFLGALQNISNLIYGSADAVTNQLRSLQNTFFDTINSQISLAVQRLETSLNSTRGLIDLGLLTARNVTLQLADAAQRVANCTSQNLNETNEAIEDVARIGYNCVVDKLNEGIDIFNVLVKNLTEQGTTIFSLPDQIDNCNKLQTGFFDFIGFLQKSNCLNSLPGKITADGLQFFAIVSKAVTDTAALAGSLPGTALACASNATNVIQQTVQNFQAEVANCTRQGN